MVNYFTQISRITQIFHLTLNLDFTDYIFFIPKTLEKENLRKQYKSK